MDGHQLGFIGEVHPTVSANAKIEGRMVGFEIDVKPLLDASRIPRAQPLPKFPSVDRDLAVVVEEHVAAAAILAGIKESAGDLLESARAFDEYHGAQVPEGYKSIAFTLTFRSPERTLTDAEVDKVMAAIKQGLENRHNARFRA
jgi:phenylalanyl-tRNA synthetase beta chain